MEGFIPIGKAFVNVRAVKWVACDEEMCEFQIGKEPVSRVTKVGMPDTYKDVKARYEMLMRSWGK